MNTSYESLIDAAIEAIPAAMQGTDNIIYLGSTAYAGLCYEFKAGGVHNYKGMRVKNCKAMPTNQIIITKQKHDCGD